MMDQSSSLANALNGTTTWWASASTGLASFFQDSQVAGTGVGIQYFGLSGIAPASCPSTQYATPEVEIAPLSSNAQSLVNSINAHAPITFTPTGPALQGAVDHAKAWAPAHPTRQTVVVLVTDGLPTECTPSTVTEIAAIAKTAFDTSPQVRTFVVALEDGSDLTTLDQIAVGGGTVSAIHLHATDMPTKLHDAMVSIATAKLACELDIPPPPVGTLDPNFVSVRFTSSASLTQTMIPRIAMSSSCSQNGDAAWYFDNLVAPTKIILCPGTCASLVQGTLDVVYGCFSLIGTG